MGFVVWVLLPWVVGDGAEGIVCPLSQLSSPSHYELFSFPARLQVCISAAWGRGRFLISEQGFFFFTALELFYCSLNLVFGVCYFSIHIYKEWSTFTENVKKFISPRRLFFLWKQHYYQGILFLLLYGPWKVGEVSVVLAHGNFRASLTSLHLWQYLNHK